MSKEAPITCLEVFERTLKEFNRVGLGLESKSISFKNPVRAEVEFDDDQIYSHAASYMVYESCVTFNFLGKRWLLAVGQKDSSPMGEYYWCDLVLVGLDDNCSEDQVEIQFADKIEDEPYSRYSVLIGNSCGYIIRPSESIYRDYIKDWHVEAIFSMIANRAALEDDICLSKASYAWNCGKEVACIILDVIFLFFLK